MDASMGLGVHSADGSLSRSNRVTVGRSAAIVEVLRSVKDRAKGRPDGETRELQQPLGRISRNLPQGLKLVF
jgi:hypothetical protein